MKDLQAMRSAFGRGSPGIVRACFLPVAIIAIAFFILAGCQREAGTRTRVIASTTMIEAVVREIGGPTVSVQALIPGGMCPGHFDIKPRQMEDIERSDLFLYHGWEEWLPKVCRVVGPQAQIAGVGIEENWMVPDVHIRAIHAVRDTLISMAPEHQAYYAEQASRYEEAVLADVRSICRTFRPYQGTRVICSELQAEFLAWLGFDVVGTFGRAESMTPRTLENLIDAGRRNDVRLVVDNLQSGASVGLELAEETGAAHVVLTNFPMGDSYLNALRNNVESLRKQLP
jgi:zinc transport system substrate-binding protein